MNLVLRSGIALLMASSLTAAPHSVPSPDPDPAGLLIADGGLGGLLEIASHDVRVVINNGIAVTTIDQVFHNTENRMVEALYSFPVPKNASVANFSMWIGGKEMVGEVVEKQRAREIYESYKARRIDPGLLEQVDYKTFEMRIFPIAADAEQRVQVTYYQELDVDADWCTYVYPLATTTRPGLDAQVTGRFSLTLEAKSEVPIDAMRSTSHDEDFVVVDHAATYYEASLEASGADLARDVVISWQLSRAETGLDFVASNTEDDAGYLQVTLTGGKELEQLDEGMDYVFVSDVSGSMRDDGKLAMSMDSTRAFLGALGDNDRFEVISFNVQATTLFNQLSDVDPDALERAGEFLDGQSARGGTRLRPAIDTAYRYLDPDRQLNVVVLSDGMTEQDEHRQLLQLIEARPTGVRVFCIGVGNEVNRPLLRQVARDTGGLAAFVSRGDDLERQAKAFRRKLLRPAIADVSITIDGAQLFDVEPAVMPNLYHGSPVRMYARYGKSGPATVKLRGTVLGRVIEREFEIDLPEIDRRNPELERMWAWHRVQRLYDDERRDGTDAKRIAEIVRLCEGYSIISEHASFLVLENDAEYQRWAIERRNATRIERDRRAQRRLREELDEIRDDVAKGLGPNAEPTESAAEPKRTVTPTNRTTRRAPAPAPVERRPAPTRRRSGGGGGGAIDPMTGSLALGLALLALAHGRRRRDDEPEVSA